MNIAIDNRYIISCVCTTRRKCPFVCFLCIRVYICTWNSLYYFAIYTIRLFVSLSYRSVRFIMLLNCAEKLLAYRITIIDRFVPLLSFIYLFASYKSFSYTMPAL